MSLAIDWHGGYLGLMCPLTTGRRVAPMSAPLRNAAEAGFFHAPRFRAALAVSPRRRGEMAGFVSEGWTRIMYDLGLTQPEMRSGGLCAVATELTQAIEQFRRDNGRMFPTWDEVIEIIESIGYKKREIHSSETPDKRLERRREPRYMPGHPGTYLGWWEGEAFLAEPGTLCNFSEGGAAIAIDADLCGRANDSVWLCIAGHGQVDWVPAQLLAQEGRIARLRFHERLPYMLFELLI